MPRISICFWPVRSPWPPWWSPRIACSGGGFIVSPRCVSNLKLDSRARPYPACLRRIFQGMRQFISQRFEFFRPHPLLHGLEQLSLFLSDMRGEQFREPFQFALVHHALSGVEKVLSQSLVFAAEFFHQQDELGETTGGGKQNLLLRREMEPNFVRVVLVRFELPLAEIHGAGLQRPTQPYTERQRMVVLMRKRDQVRVAPHGSIIRLC